MAKCNTCFIKKVSQLKSDIRSYPLENFSLKQASGLMEGGGGVGAGPDPRTLPLDPENRDSRCHFTTVFSENVEVVKAGFQILDVLSFCD